MINLSTGAFYERNVSQMGKLRAKAESFQNQIATQERLERSSDDPVAAARLRTLARGERLAEVDERGSRLAETDLLLTDKALQSVADVIIRARTLAISAQSPAVGDKERAAMGLEIEGLRESLVLLANGRNAAGHALFGGQAPGAAYTDGPGGAVFVGTAAVDAIEIGEGQTVTPGMTGPQIFDFTDANGATNLFAVLGNLATALAAGGTAAADAANGGVNSLDVGLEKITTAQTVIGSRLNWVDLMNERREDNSERVAQESADVGGADFASSLSRLTETMSVLEATQASFMKLANLSLFSMLR